MRGQKTVICLAAFVFVLLIGLENVAEISSANAAPSQAQELKEHGLRLDPWTRFEPPYDYSRLLAELTAKLPSNVLGPAT